MAAHYLLDTNLISETRKIWAGAGVNTFLAAAEAAGLFLSVLTLGELREAVEAKRRGVGRSFLRHAGFAQASEKRATRTALRGTVFSFAGEGDVTLRNPVGIGNRLFEHHLRSSRT